MVTIKCLINDYLHTVMKANGDYTVVGGEDVFDVNIVPNVGTMTLTKANQSSMFLVRNSAGTNCLQCDTNSTATPNIVKTASVQPFTNTNLRHRYIFVKIQQYLRCQHRSNRKPSYHFNK